MRSKSNRVGVFESNRKLEVNDGMNFWSHTRDVSSRYKSPTPRRCPSPNISRTFTKAPLHVSTRAVSTERRRSGTPKLPSCPSTSDPSTPVHDTSVDMELVAGKVIGGKMPDSLWPSRMCSLSVSFQSDKFSVSSSKREKPPPQALSDRTLKSSSNVSQKRNLTSPRKTTPDRKRSPLKGKNVINQTENRWPSRTSSKVLNKNIDFSDKTIKSFIAPNINVRMHLENSTSDPVSVRLLSSNTDNRRLKYDDLKRMSNLVSSSLSERLQSFPAVEARRPSPNKPSQIRPITPGPSRIRPSSPLRQVCNFNRVSVLSFVADIKRGKKVSDHIEDAHYLRLLYNRQNQWRFVNADTEATLKSQKLTAKKSLYNVWRNTSELRDSVAAKRIELDQLRLKLKLISVLNQQKAYLDEWASIEKEYTFALSGSIDDLQSSTLRLPVTKGATVNIETLKSSFCSAIHVMQTIGSSIQSTLLRLEGPNCVANDLANVAAKERALLDECELLLVFTASLQEKEYSLRTHLVQLKHESWNK